MYASTGHGVVVLWNHISTRLLRTNHVPVVLEDIALSLEPSALGLEPFDVDLQVRKAPQTGEKFFGEVRFSPPNCI